MEILRYAAFTADPAGGNPAGVVLDATGVSDTEMLRVAANIGYSETAFLVPRGSGRFEVRYFSPKAEVPFCGHATIASAAAYAERHGPGVLHLDTRAGLVEVSTTVQSDGTTTATLISVAPRTRPIAASDLTALLEALGWAPGDLDATMPPRVAFAGAWHPIVATASRQRLANLDYDMNALSRLMARHDWTTVDLVCRESPHVFYARNPFPPGGVVEDPATGAAAAAFGGYLRELGLVTPPVTVTVHQGEDMGRPSVLKIGIPAQPRTGIAVTGTAVALAR
ncbi:PhzF family phenazine biosynthesis isomerase [Micromonospora sp. WMMD812]|uniref:PhzF family phenazine biosynthesis protein n=1 Tax=Micromonospora sp. WMMD812 TaxID=3015152 RepID=UPI00248C9CB0|nr:PhzF family phenazine biosynthesis isomerase [Micromonospora sp. WMMD812]WBB71167.1 PhzF family phenazine biosynthesis isomerase [Micromonospora sp. WMMD812]